MRRKTAPIVAILAGVALLSTSVARGGENTQIKAFTGPPKFLGYDPFQPADGTLDEVRVQFNAQAFITVQTTPLFSGPSPVPYGFVVDAEHQWFNPGPKGFDFNDSAKLILNGVASGAGGPMTLVRPYTMDFKYTASLDAVGFSPVNASGIQPTTSAIGKRSNFVAAAGGIYELDMVGTSFTASPGLVVPLTQTHSGTVTLTYKFTPPPPPILIKLIILTNPLVIPTAMVNGQARYQDIDTGLLTETKHDTADVRGSISTGENADDDTVGARGAANIAGDVRSLSRAAGKGLFDQPSNPTLAAFTDAKSVTDWIVLSDTLAPGTPIGVDVKLRIKGDLTTGDGSGLTGVGQLFASVREKLQLFKESDPQWVSLHDGGGTLDALGGLLADGGWNFDPTNPAANAPTSIDQTILLHDLFTVNVGEQFGLDLTLRTDAQAPDALERFALADFFDDGKGVWFELSSDEAVTLAPVSPVPEPGVAVLGMLAAAAIGARLLSRRRV